MTDDSQQHGSSGAPSSEVPEPSLAERARTLMHLGGVSSLSTMSQKHPGYPFGSVMPYAVDDGGAPIFLISAMAMHTHNIKREPKCTLLVQPDDAGSDPLGGARISVMGDVTVADDDQRDRLAELYLARHEQAQFWINFGDFKFFTMQVVDVYFIGGFGVMGWIKSEDYAAAAPDPIADAANDIIQHMNDDHVEAMQILARHHLGVEASNVNMTSVDRLGFNVKLLTDEGVRGGRIGFSEAVSSATEVRTMLVQMIKTLRS